ncbi:hypothetical protein [Streptomyces griseoflavus]|uniref:Membrane protein n=1 Tax=Streptomyces griseoflavus Tu4000 TaxID=467200 RepID=D9Y0C2_9ACTN|nr:hypothetical protein [Streptomyces griseoflavus]EFL41317.1 membrane protein [Streptomyces griseoflavus Tu4000]
MLTLRLLPPVARLAERRAARSRGLPGALAGWQFSRRPMRGAGPVLLLVLAVALGMLAIGQASSWERSQDDQADFRAGAPVRVLSAGESGFGRTQEYAAVPGVRAAAPAVRTSVPLSGGRTATVLALFFLRTRRTPCCCVRTWRRRRCARSRPGWRRRARWPACACRRAPRVWR